MKTYKRTRFIASMAIVGSLTLSGVTFAATDSQPVTGSSTASSTIERPFLGRNRIASSTLTLFKKSQRKNASPQFTGTSTQAISGIVTAINGNSFTLSRQGFATSTMSMSRMIKNAHASTTPNTHSKIQPHFTPSSIATTTYTVNTTDGTVYMKDGKLDSLTDITVGSFVSVTGTLDKATNTVTALGVHIVDMTKMKANVVNHKVGPKKK
ncbi:MAG: DUF5666 domain-containing protein [Candidatus Taylorbacteria bacterium]